MTPGERVQVAGRVHGDETVAVWCATIVAGADWADTPERLAWIADPTVHTDEWLDKPVNAYWPRVWAARALLYAWADAAVDGVVAGLSDPAWRVREMCAKVARRHGVLDAVDRLADLTGDEVPRVREAARRALATLT